MSAADGPERTLLRHGRRARLAHLVLALLVLALIVSGLGMGGRLPDSLTNVLGGHEKLAAWHRQLGLVFGACLLGLPLVAGGRLRRMLAEMVRFHRSELRWFVPFLRYCLRPHRHEPPFHYGRYDPGQRIVFLLLGSSLLVCTLSGLVLYVAPPQHALLLAWAIRFHVGASVALIAGVGLHTLAGSGLLPSHRGVARGMFGDGRVAVVLARRLWPGWTARQLHWEVQRGAWVAARPRGKLQRVGAAPLRRGPLLGGAGEVVRPRARQRHLAPAAGRGRLRRVGAEDAEDDEGEGGGAAHRHDEEDDVEEQDVRHVTPYARTRRLLTRLPPRASRRAASPRPPSPARARRPAARA